MNDVSVSRLLLQVAPIVSNRVKEILELAAQTLEVQQHQIESQKEMLQQLRLNLAHVQAHGDALLAEVNQWHKIADERSTEINRLLRELKSLRQMEK